MEKTLGYIFGSLQLSEVAIGKIIKDLKKQGKVNRGFALLFALGGVYIYANEVLREENNKKIETLTKEVEELKKMKGE